MTALQARERGEFGPELSGAPIQPSNREEATRMITEFHLAGGEGLVKFMEPLESQVQARAKAIHAYWRYPKTLEDGNRPAQPALVEEGEHEREGEAAEDENSPTQPAPEEAEERERGRDETPQEGEAQAAEQTPSEGGQTLPSDEEEPEWQPGDACWYYTSKDTWRSTYVVSVAGGRIVLGCHPNADSGRMSRRSHPFPLPAWGLARGGGGAPSQTASEVGARDQGGRTPPQAEADRDVPRQDPGASEGQGEGGQAAQAPEPGPTPPAPAEPPPQERVRDPLEEVGLDGMESTGAEEDGEPPGLWFFATTTLEAESIWENILGSHAVQDLLGTPVAQLSWLQCTPGIGAALAEAARKGIPVEGREAPTWVKLNLTGWAYLSPARGALVYRPQGGGDRRVGRVRRAD